MANNNRLTVEIAGNNSDLKKTLQESKAELAKFAKEVDNYKNSGFNNAMSNEKVQAEKLANALKQVKLESAQLTLEKRKTTQATEVASGSYREAQQRLTALGKSIREAEGGFEQMTPELQNQIRQYTELNQRLKIFDASMGNNQRNVGNYGMALGNASGVAMEFNRIIQDAPFGMMGIGNNIQQLTANWQQYVQQARASATATGTTVTTMALAKGAIASIISPANLLTLGIAAVTSAWTFYTMWSQKANKANKEVKESTESYIDTLKGVARASADGQVNADKDLSSLKLLYQATQNLTIPMEARRKAAEELIKQYPKQFKGLSEESIMAGNASKAYDALTKSITATAMAAAYASRVTENSKKQLDNTLKIIDKQTEANKLQVQIDKQTAIAARNNKAAGGVVGGSNAAGFQEASRLQEKQKSITKDIVELGNANSVLTKENTLLQGNYNTQIANGADASGKVNTELKKVKDTTKQAEREAERLKDMLRELEGGKMSDLDRSIFEIKNKYIDLAKEFKNNPDVLGLLNEARNAEILRKEVENIIYLMDGIKPLTGQTSGIKPSGTIATPDISGRLAKDLELSNAKVRNANAKFKATDDEKLEERISKVIEGGFRKSISGILENITELGGDFKTIFSNVFGQLQSGFKSVLSDVFGTYLGDKFKKAFDELDFGGLGKNVSKALVAGVGMAGSLISGATSKTSGVGQGIGGALSGAAMGTAILPGLGTAIGGVIGAISGIFGASKAKKEQRIQEEQLAEQKKQTALAERLNQMAFASSIIGQMSAQGTVTGFDLNAFGEIITRIDGKSIALVLDRTKDSRG